MNTYRLESAFGTFEVEGRALLVVRSREIDAMTELAAPCARCSASWAVTS
jgi:hypothetical protein